MSLIPALMGGRKLSHSLDFDSSAAASALLRFGVQTLDMDDAAVQLVTKQTSTSGEVQLSGQVLIVDSTSSGVEILSLPPEADSKGLFLILYNNGGEVITVKDDDATLTVATVANTETCLLWCDGGTTNAYGAGHVGWTGVLLKHLID